MSVFLNSLSAELFLLIVEHLNQSGDQEALRSLSCTCLSYRSLLAPYIFKAISLHNDKRSASSVLTLANSRYSELVQVLRYTSSARVEDRNDGSGEQSGQEIDEMTAREKSAEDANNFPATVQMIISNLHRYFPCLETLSIQLNDNVDWNDFDGGIHKFQDEETAEEILSAEDTESWRALMVKTYKTLTQNPQPCIKTLDIRLLMLIELSTFSDGAFHDFLSTLERFDLSIRGGDNGFGWNINTLSGYLAVASKIDKFFVDHLKNVTHFTLKSSESIPLGLEGMRHTQLALNADQMPMLKCLHLENVFVCPELVDFFVGHARTLKSVFLHNCFASTGRSTLAENGIAWDVLFNAFANAEPKELHQFSIMPRQRPDQPGILHGDDGQAELTHGKAQQREARLILDESPERILFAYVYLDDKYGWIFDDEALTREAFLQQDDQRSYERLLEIIAANGSRLGT